VSRLARKVAITTMAVLGLQFVGGIVAQLTLATGFRNSLVTKLYHDLDASGLLDDCTAQPGPWRHLSRGRAAWPVAPDGRVIGADAPFARVELPPPGETLSGVRDGWIREVYASTSPGCGGIVHVVDGRLPALELFSARLAGVGMLRFLLTVLVGVLLVVLTAVPLVRRIRALSQAMHRIVQAGFDGTIDDPADDELGDVARAFDTAAASVRDQVGRLEHRDAVMRRALADFAHDVRTPLTTLQITLSGLPAGDGSARMRRELGYLHDMVRTVESVLARDDEDERSVVALDQVAERVQSRFEPLAVDRGVSFRVSLPDERLHVLADANEVERAVSNLVQNALRFCAGHVVLLVFRRDDEVRLEVRDDGPGFGPSLERASERGVRGDDVDGPGSGLGLAIAEATARRHGGRLELANDHDATVAALVLPTVGLSRRGGGTAPQR